MTDLSQLAIALAALMERHEALRTRLYGIEDGDPGQSLADSGALPVTVVEEADPQQAEATARALLDELSATRFDYAGSGRCASASSATRGG